MSKKAATKIINNNIDKTIKYSYNTINTKSSYFIIDGFLYETDLKTVLRKERLSDCLNLKELDNKLFTAPILKQTQAYRKDNFKIVSIQDENNILIIKLTDGSIIAKIQAAYSAIPENLLNFCSAKKELPKTYLSYDRSNKQKRITSKYFSLIGTYLNHDFFICSKSDNIYAIIDNKAYYMFNGMTENRKELLKNMSIEYLNNFLNNTYKITIPQPNKGQFNFINFAIYYLIANLEQQKQSEKPAKNLLPVLYKAGQKTKKEINRDKLNYEKIVKQITVDNKIKAICGRALKNLKALEYDFIMQISAMKKTPLKSINKPLQIEFKKQVLSLPCKQVYLLPSPTAVSLPAEKQKTKDHFADFEIKYLTKVREKKRYRKANSKFAVIFQQIGQFSSAACLIFLFLNSFVMIEKSKNTFQNLAKMENKQTKQQEIAKEPIKTISNLSDNTQDGMIYCLDNKTAKNTTSDSLKWISFAMFGMIKRKEESMKKKKVYFDSETQYSTRLGDQMVFTNGKAGKNFVAECKQIYHSPANGKWYYMFEQI